MDFVLDRCWTHVCDVGPTLTQQGIHEIIVCLDNHTASNCVMQCVKYNLPSESYLIFVNLEASHTDKVNQVKVSLHGDKYHAIAKIVKMEQKLYQCRIIGIAERPYYIPVSMYLGALG